MLCAMDSDPRQVISRWLPHILLIALLVMGLWVLTLVLRPLLEPILLAAALAMLTAPFIYQPCEKLVARLLPKSRPAQRRQLAGIASTVVLVLLLLAPVLLLLANTVGSVSGTFDLIVGLATKDAEQITKLEQSIGNQIKRVDDLYTNIDLASYELPKKLRAIITEAMDFGSAFLNFMAAGTGILAHLVLAVISLAFFYAEGPRLSRALLAYSPLDTDQQEQLVARYRAIMLHLINDTVAIAVLKGTVLALVIYSVDHLLGQQVLPFVPIAILAALITLLPVVGVTMVWLPLAGLEWSLGSHAAAITIAVGCTAAHYGLDILRRRVGRKIGDRESWMNFLLFLGLVGGLLSFGIKGLIIGPMAVVFVATIGSFWGPLYGLGPDRISTTRLTANKAPPQPEQPSS